MNIYLLDIYIKKISKDDIVKFAKKEGIELEDKELEVIYFHVKNNYRTFIYGNTRDILDDIKSNVRESVYSKIEELYLRYKSKL